MYKPAKFEPITFKSFDTSVAAHCFTTRHGGVSAGIYASMNLGYNRGDDSRHVFHNYSIVCDYLRVNINRLAFTSQVHGKGIRAVGEADFPDSNLPNDGYAVKTCDAIMTDTAGITLVSFSADCVPLFFVDPVRKAVALAHAGWKGTLLDIGSLTVRRMMAEYGCKPADILAGIGPSIGGCCFETRSDVAFGVYNTGKYAEFVTDMGDGKYKVDLWGINKKCIETLLPKGNIELSGLCTKCDSGRFFSHRAMGEDRGTMASFICLKS